MRAERERARARSRDGAGSGTAKSLPCDVVERMFVVCHALRTARPGPPRQRIRSSATLSVAPPRPAAARRNARRASSSAAAPTTDRARTAIER